MAFFDVESMGGRKHHGGLSRALGRGSFTTASMGGKYVQGGAKTSKWLEFCKKFRASHPKATLKQISAEYKGGEAESESEEEEGGWASGYKLTEPQKIKQQLHLAKGRAEVRKLAIQLCKEQRIPMKVVKVKGKDGKPGHLKPKPPIHMMKLARETLAKGKDGKLGHPSIRKLAIRLCKEQKVPMKRVKGRDGKPGHLQPPIHMMDLARQTLHDGSISVGGYAVGGLDHGEKRFIHGIKGDKSHLEHLEHIIEQAMHDEHKGMGTGRMILHHMIKHKHALHGGKLDVMGFLKKIGDGISDTFHFVAPILPHVASLL